MGHFCSLTGLRFFSCSVPYAWLLLVCPFSPIAFICRLTTIPFSSCLVLLPQNQKGLLDGKAKWPHTFGTVREKGASPEAPSCTLATDGSEGEVCMQEKGCCQEGQLIECKEERLGARGRPAKAQEASPTALQIWEAFSPAASWHSSLMLCWPLQRCIVRNMKGADITLVSAPGFPQIRQAKLLSSVVPKGPRIKEPQRVRHRTAKCQRRFWAMLPSKVLSTWGNP